MEQARRLALLEQRVDSLVESVAQLAALVVDLAARVDLTRCSPS